jgi:hypothetical protein
MCMIIDDSVMSSNKRTVWKVFDKSNGGTKIVSLYQQAVYPKGKLVERDAGAPRYNNRGTHGLHFFTTKSQAKRTASNWLDAYIAKFAVDPKDFMFAGRDENAGEAMYERATRVGNFIRVKMFE